MPLRPPDARPWPKQFPSQASDRATRSMRGSDSHRSSEAFSSRTASFMASPSRARAKQRMLVVLPVPGGPCSPVATAAASDRLVSRERGCQRAWSAECPAYGNDEVGHVALARNDLEPRVRLLVADRVLQLQRPVLFDPAALPPARTTTRRQTHAARLACNLRPLRRGPRDGGARCVPRHVRVLHAGRGGGGHPRGLLCGAPPRALQAFDRHTGRVMLPSAPSVVVVALSLPCVFLSLSLARSRAPRRRV